MNTSYFLDRKEAARRLTEKLLRFKGQSSVVLALPRGGVPVGFEIAKALAAPLDLVLVRKIGAPYQPEFAIGAVVDGPHALTVRNDEVIGFLDVPETYIEEETARQLKEIERRREIYLAGRPRVAVEGRVAILVDDGIATGATARAALQAIRQAKPAKLVLAVPVAPPDTVAMLRKEVDELICLLTPEYFGAISRFYLDFRQVTDDEVIELMKSSARFGAAEAPANSASDCAVAW